MIVVLITWYPPQEYPTPQPKIIEQISDDLLELAQLFFDATQSLHNLDLESREILVQAARLRSATLHLTKKKPFISALGLIQSQRDQVLSIESQRSLAGVIAMIHGRLKAKDLDTLDFSSAQQQVILTISAILRIAGGLDKSGIGAAEVERIEQSEGGLWIVVSGQGTDLDSSPAEKAADLWEKLGYPEISVLLPEQAAIRSAPFPSPMSRIGMHPDDPLSEAWPQGDDLSFC